MRNMKKNKFFKNKSYKLYICERHFTPDYVRIYPARKTLKESSLPTLNLSREKADNATRPSPAKANEKHEEEQILQEQTPQPAQNANKLFKDFTSRIKILALALKLKNWKVEVKEQLVVVFVGVFRLYAFMRNICRQS